MEQDRADTQATLTGLAHPITEAYENGGVESAAGAVLAQVAAFAAGGGLRTARGTGAARVGSRAATAEAAAAETAAVRAPVAPAPTPRVPQGPVGGMGDWAEGLSHAPPAPVRPPPLQINPSGPLAPAAPAAPLTPLRPTPAMFEAGGIPRITNSVPNAPLAAEVPFTPAYNQARFGTGPARVNGHLHQPNLAAPPDLRTWSPPTSPAPVTPMQLPPLPGVGR